MNLPSVGTINGFRVVSTLMAVKRSVSYEVRRHPIRKRRRQWSVVRVEREEPTVLVSELMRTMFVHSTVLSQLRELQK